jgi:hypothetical protein
MHRDSYMLHVHFRSVRSSKQERTRVPSPKAELRPWDQLHPASKARDIYSLTGFSNEFRYQSHVYHDESNTANTFRKALFPLGQETLPKHMYNKLYSKFHG